MKLPGQIGQKWWACCRIISNWRWLEYHPSNSMAFSFTCEWSRPRNRVLGVIQYSGRYLVRLTWKSDQVILVLQPLRYDFRSKPKPKPQPKEMPWIIQLLQYCITLTRFRTLTQMRNKIKPFSRLFSRSRSRDRSRDHITPKSSFTLITPQGYILLNSCERDLKSVSKMRSNLCLYT